MDQLIWILIFLGVILIGFFSGRAKERAHLRSLDEREARVKGLLTTNLRKVPPEWDCDRSWLVGGNVVIASDAFKTFAARLKHLIGGHLRTVESLMLRARREALLRLQESAIAGGAQCIMNVRFETATISRGQGNSGMAQVEVFAYGTAITFADTAGT